MAKLTRVLLQMRLLDVGSAPCPARFGDRCGDPISLYLCLCLLSCRSLVGLGLSSTGGAAHARRLPPRLQTHVC